MIVRMRFMAVALGSVGMIAAGACESFDEGRDPARQAADGGGPDAGSEPDGGGDAPAIVGADAGCRHTFCADFETDPYDAPFDGPVGSQNVKISLSPSAANPGRALRTTVPAGTYAIGSSHYLRKKFTQAPRKVTFDFRVLVLASPIGLAENTVQIATVGWGGEDANADRVSEIQTRIGPDIVLAKRDEIADNDTQGAALTMKSAWMRVHGELTFGTSRNVTAVVTVDDQVTLEESFVSDSAPANVEIGVGGAGLDGNQNKDIVFDIDDVTLDITSD